jgi:hypothetical protein
VRASVDDTVALDGESSSLSNALVANAPGCGGGGGGGGGESASKSMTSGGSGCGVRTASRSEAVSCRRDGAAAAAAFDGVRRPWFMVDELRCTDTVPSARRSTRSVKDCPLTIRVLVVLVETTPFCTDVEKNEDECPEGPCSAKNGRGPNISCNGGECQNGGGGYIGQGCIVPKGPRPKNEPNRLDGSLRMESNMLVAAAAAPNPPLWKPL